MTVACEETPVLAEVLWRQLALLGCQERIHPSDESSPQNLKHLSGLPCPPGVVNRGYRRKTLGSRLLEPDGSMRIPLPLLVLLPLLSSCGWDYSVTVIPESLVLKPGESRTAEVRLDRLAKESILILASGPVEGLEVGSGHVEEGDNRGTVKLTVKPDAHEGPREVTFRMESNGAPLREVRFRVEVVHPPLPTTGTLRVTLTAPIPTPTNLPWASQLKGPDGFERRLVSDSFDAFKPLLLENLAPGAYTLLPERVYRVSTNGPQAPQVLEVFVPSARSLPVTVTAGETASLSFHYTERPNAARIWASDSAHEALTAWRYWVGSPYTLTVSLPVGSGAGHMAVDAEGHLYLEQPGTKTLVRYAASQLDTSGTQSPETVLEGVDSPAGLAFDPRGALWYASGNQVVKLDPKALVAPGRRTVSPTLTLQGGLSGARAPTFDKHGNLYVISTGDDRVVKFAAAQLAGSGNVTVEPAATFTSAGIRSPRDLAFDPDGHLLVSNSGPMGTFLSRFLASQLEASGAVTLEPHLRLQSQDLLSAGALAFDETRAVWVVDTASRKLVAFSAGQLAGAGTFNLRAANSVATGSDGTCVDLVLSPPAFGTPLPR
jgi:sugar lactone lactonase YvrE